MNFGQAIEALKQGKKVARRGWNGKDMFLYMTEGTTVHFNDLRGNAAKFITEQTTSLSDACISSHIDMKATDGTVVVGWLASQTDMLAEDWHIVD